MQGGNGGRRIAWGLLVLVVTVVGSGGGGGGGSGFHDVMTNWLRRKHNND